MRWVAFGTVIETTFQGHLPWRPHLPAKSSVSSATGPLKGLTCRTYGKLPLVRWSREDWIEAIRVPLLTPLYEDCAQISFPFEDKLIHRHRDVETAHKSRKNIRWSHEHLTELHGAWLISLNSSRFLNSHPHATVTCLWIELCYFAIWQAAATNSMHIGFKHFKQITNYDNLGFSWVTTACWLYSDPNISGPGY